MTGTSAACRLPDAGSLPSRLSFIPSPKCLSYLYLRRGGQVTMKYGVALDMPTESRSGSSPAPRSLSSTFKLD